MHLNRHLIYSKPNIIPQGASQRLFDVDRKVGTPSDIENQQLWHPKVHLKRYLTYSRRIIIPQGASRMLFDVDRRVGTPIDTENLKLWHPKVHLKRYLTYSRPIMIPQGASQTLFDVLQANYDTPRCISNAIWSISTQLYCFWHPRTPRILLKRMAS